MAADQGFADAQFRLGRNYESGKGVPRDYASALVWYKQSAEHGNADAQTSLGKMYTCGNGVKKDLEEAAIVAARLRPDNGSLPFCADSFRKSLGSK